MTDLKAKTYIVVVQCEIARQRCSGYGCEQACHERAGGFAEYPKDQPYRILYLTCGGCCGRGVQRRLMHLVKKAGKREGLGKEQIVVQLASCVTKDNYHAPPCPHLDYLRTIIARIGLDVRLDTVISHSAEKRRQAGVYRPTC